jgi:hypothetical protein
MLHLHRLKKKKKKTLSQKDMRLAKLIRGDDLHDFRDQMPKNGDEMFLALDPRRGIKSQIDDLKNAVNGGGSYYEGGKSSSRNDKDSDGSEQWHPDANDDSES